MTAIGLSFTPPPVVIDDSIAWALEAAFADSPSHRRPRDAPRALQFARRGELSGRIASRLELTTDASRLGALGPELLADYHNNLAVDALLTRARDQITAHADRLGVAIVPVKFAALRLANIVTPGSRMAGDLDLLVPRSQAMDFWEALLAVGFSRTHARAYPHQLEALVDPYGAVVELHLHLPGVFVDDKPATADTLIAHELAARTSGSVWVPNSSLLAAHAIAHALLQNRATPQSYSPLRMIADIQDLRRIQPNVVAQARRYLAPALHPTCVSLERLADCLSKGVFEGSGFDGTSEQTLLWHCIAAREDFDYSERLRAAGLLNKFRDGSSVVEIAKFVAGTLFPADAELDALYGPASGRLAQLRRRSMRPVDLAARAVRRWLVSRQQ